MTPKLDPAPSPETHERTGTRHVWRCAATGRFVYEDETNCFSDADYATEAEAAAALAAYAEAMLRPRRGWRVFVVDEAGGDLLDVYADSHAEALAAYGPEVTRWATPHEQILQSLTLVYAGPRRPDLEARLGLGTFGLTTERRGDGGRLEVTGWRPGGFDQTPGYFVDRAGELHPLARVGHVFPGGETHHVLVPLQALRDRCD
jgi:hypothetical protein